MFGSVPESELLYSTIVATDKVKRCHNDAELNQINDEELKWRGIKCVVPKPACDSVDRDPAHYVQNKVKRGSGPFVVEKMRPETNSAPNPDSGLAGAR